MTDYPDTKLFIDGSWRPGSAGRTLAVINPATEQQIGMVACAEIADLDAAGIAQATASSKVSASPVSAPSAWQAAM